MPDESSLLSSGILYRIKELCIKLVIEKSLYYDARSEKHQIKHQIVVVRLRFVIPYKHKTD